MQHLAAFLHANNIAYSAIEALPQSGGDRKYFRIHTVDTTLIATLGENTIENNTFLSFSKTFAELELAVPAIIAQNKEGNIYLQQDLGQTCLLDMVLQHGYTSEVFLLYQQALQQLAKMQITSHVAINYDLCIANKAFDENAALYDLQYCQHYFADQVGIQYNKLQLQSEFIALSKVIGAIEPIYFMYRDFQGRNIMVHHQQVFFIDYQGGMQGPLAYDVASLLWQAKAQLPPSWKIDLFNYYIQCANEYLPFKIAIEKFTEDYYLIVLMRLLQVLGAYGRRGLQEKKNHFISSIPYGIHHLQEWMQLKNIAIQYPTIHQLLVEIIKLKSAFKTIE